MKSATTRRVESGLGAVGRTATAVVDPILGLLTHVSGVGRLLAAAVYFATIGPLRGRSRLRKQLGPMLAGVGVRSLPIVALVSVLIGAILVLQTGDVMRRYGQIQEVPGLVALSVTRELGPLMTAIIMTARVGASFTAVIAAMRLNDEVLALETMAIHPVGYLVSPRVVSMVVMLPCLTVISFVLGILGGAVLANAVYDIGFGAYAETTYQYLDVADLGTGMLKAVVFSLLISTICCYFGITASGGPLGLGRCTMVAVVTSIVVVVLADAILTGFAANYLL